MAGLFTVVISDYVIPMALEWGSGNVWELIKKHAPSKSSQEKLYSMLEQYVSKTFCSKDIEFIAPVCELLYKSIDEGSHELISEQAYKKIMTLISDKNKSGVSRDVMIESLTALIASDDLVYRTYMINLQHRISEPAPPSMPIHQQDNSTALLFWNAGKAWYDDMRAPGARFYSMAIVDYILPSGATEPERSEYKFPFRASDTNEQTVECKRFSELLHKKGSVYHKGHFMLVGEGGIGKTTTLMSAMQDTYEGGEFHGDESIIPLFVELSLAPDSQDSPAYAGTSSTAVHRLIYAALMKTWSHKSRSSILFECMNDRSNIAKDTVRAYLQSATEDSTRYVFLVDGLNEVSPEPFKDHRSSSAQERILHEIEQMVDEYKDLNITIIITGRSSVSLGPAFHTFYLRGLAEEDIKAYLCQNGKSEDECDKILRNDQGLMDVLAIPMFLTMYTKLSDTEGVITRGELMKVFFHERLSLRNENDIYRQADISAKIDADEEQSIMGSMTRSTITLSIQWLFLDILIPEIAMRMEAAGLFHVSEKDVRALLETLFKNQNSLYCGQYKAFSNQCFEKRLIGETPEDVITDFINAHQNRPAKYCKTFLNYCISSMGILYKAGSDSYGFVHQHFRDYFASVCNVNQMKIACISFEEGNRTASEDLLQKYQEAPLNPLLMLYIGEYLGEHHNSPTSAPINTILDEETQFERRLISALLNVYRNENQTNLYGVHNLVEILKRVRKDLSGANFHALDLRRCRFNNVHMDTCKGINFKNAVINASSWLIEGHTGTVSSVCYSPNGSYLVTASLDKTARVWDAYSGELVHTLKGHMQWVNCACFNPTGDRIVTSSIDNTARIWNAATGNIIHILTGHTGQLLYTCFSPKGDLIVTTSRDNTACVWDSDSGNLLHILKGHTDLVSRACFSPNGKQIITSSSDHTARIWDANSGVNIHVLSNHSGSVKFACYSPDGSCIVTTSGDHNAYIWDSDSGNLLNTLAGHTNGVRSASYSPDGKYIVTSSDDHTARIWNAKSGMLLHTLSYHTSFVFIASFNPYGDRIVTASNDKTACIWDTDSGSLLHVLKGHTGALLTACFSPDGRYIATSSIDGSARIWSVRFGFQVHSLAGSNNSLESARYNQDETSILLQSIDGSALKWDIHSGTFSHSLKGQSEWKYKKLCNFDGKYKAKLTNDGCIYIYDASSGSQSCVLKGHTDSVTSICFSKDHKFIATASSDKTARIWDASDGKLLHTLTGHGGLVRSAIYGPSNNSIVTASYDNTARIWDAQSGCLIHTLKGHTNWVTSACFNSDGSRVLTASFDDTVRIWDAKSGKQLQTIYKVSGLYIKGVNFSNINPNSSITPVQRDILRQYGAVLPEEFANT